MTTQPGNIGDERFSNWVKDTLALLYTKECLEVIADERSAVFHGQLKTAVGNNSTCTCSWQALNQDRKTQKWVVKNCPGVCQNWLNLIISHHSNRPLPKLAPRNTDPGHWPSDTWEVMKVYQSNGCQGHHSARDADVAALIDLMRNCDHFAPLITNPSLINQVITVRNKLMHSKDFKVENQELSHDLQSMLSFLHSLTAITGASSLSATEHQAVQTAITEVDKLRTSILDMTLNRELQLKALKAKHVALETDMKVLEQTIDDARADTAAVKSGLTGVKDKLSTEVQTLQQRLVSQLSMVQDVKKGLASQLSMIQDVKKDMTVQQQSTAAVVSNLTRFQQQFEDLRLDHDEVKKNITALEKQITDLEVTSQQQASTITTIYQRQQATDTELQNQQQQSQAYASQLEHHQKEIDTHTAKLGQLAEHQGKLDNNTTTLQDHAIQLQGHQSHIESQNKTLECHGTQLQGHQSHIESQHKTLECHGAKLDRLENTQIAQQTDQAVDIKGLQDQLISMYTAWIQHFPVYLLMSEKKIHLEDIYVEQRLKVVDPDGRLRSDCAVSKSKQQSLAIEPNLILLGLEDESLGKSQKFIRLLRDVFYSEDKKKIIKKCQSVYVSGNAGYGKSIFCSHLVRLWCKAHSENTTKLTPDEAVMAEFPLLFCVDLRDAKYDGTVQTPDEMCCLIQKQLQRSGVVLPYDCLSKLLQADGQVLVVMDALDECKEQHLPRGGKCNNCTTLVTSRPWKFEALRCDPECRVDKEFEIVGLEKGSPEDLSENLVKLLNKKWNKSKDSKDFIIKMIMEGLQEFLDVPVLLTSMVCLWFDDIPFGRSQVEVYRNSIHHQILAAIKAKGIPRYSCPSEVPFPVCQREKCPCKCYGELLWKVSELACKALLGNVQERSLVMDHDQTAFLGMTDEEVAICMKLGILTQYKLLGNVTDYEPQKSVSFIHKTYQEWFAAVYLSSKLPMSELDKLLSEAINDLDSALELDQMFLFVCGLEADFAAKLYEFIMSMVSLDLRVQEYRRSTTSYPSHDKLIRTIQDVVVAGAVEAKKNNKKNTALQLHDVLIDPPYSSRFSTRFSNEQILACDKSHARSVSINVWDSDVQKRKLTSWLESSCLERLVLRYTAEAPDDTFRFNLSATKLVVLYLEYVTLTHAQLESLCESLATTEGVRNVNICWLNCKTHTNNSQECYLQLDLYQHIGLKLISFQKINQSWLQRPNIKIRSWPPSPCLETVDLRHVNISSCDTFCDNLNIDMVSKMYLKNITLTHDQLKSLGSLATAGSLRTMYIRGLTCITYKDNKQTCSITLDLSQHHKLEKLVIHNVGVGEVRGVSLCHNMDKLRQMELRHVKLTHDQLENLCQATAGSLSTLYIRGLTCTTHKDNMHDCRIMLDLSRHQELNHLIVWKLGVGEIQGVSLCQNMDKLEKVVLGGFCISAAALRQTLEALPEGHCVSVRLGGMDSPLRVKGTEEARQLLVEIGRTPHTLVTLTYVEYKDDHCVIRTCVFYNNMK